MIVGGLIEFWLTTPDGRTFMTELQKLYFAARREGLKHHAALRSLARQTGLDKDTIDRCLKRARRDQS